MSAQQPKSGLLRMRHWPAWVLVSLSWPMVRFLPWHWLIRLGESFGTLAWLLARERRHVASTNIRLCFPELDASARDDLVRQHFRALGAAFMELLLSALAKTERLNGLAHIEGMEHLQAAQEKGKGVLLLSAHFSCLTMTGRLLCNQMPFAVMYRPHGQALVEHLVRSYLERHALAAIRRDEVREVVRLLRRGQVVWYAPDQALRTGNPVMAPFFGVPASTHPGTARLAAITRSPVVPFFGYRLPGRQGYRLIIMPALEDFPSEDPVADASRVNQLIENAIRLAPEQYFWTHRRFKYGPDSGLKDPYDD